MLIPSARVNVSAGISLVEPVGFSKPNMPVSTSVVHVNITPCVSLSIATEFVVPPVIINWSVILSVTFVVGLTVMVNVCESSVVHVTPSLVNIGVTSIVTTLGSESRLFAVKVISAVESVMSVVESGKPISGPVADHEYVVTPPVLAVVKSITISSSPLQTSMSDGWTIVGVGFTVMVKVSVGPVHSIPLLV